MSYHLWHDTYDLAFRMYNHTVGTHRAELDVLDISVADKSAKLIGFDPFTGKYELLIMQADLNTPIKSLVRELAGCDVEEIRKSQDLATSNYPRVIIVKLLHALPPFGLVVFNCEYKKPIYLEKELQNLASNLKPALIGDIFPGAILLRKHDDKLYRVMIIGQVGDKYELLLVDYAARGSSRLEKLFMLKPEVDLSNFPCALMICRIRGFRKLNKFAFSEFKKHVDEHGMKEKVKAVVFKQDEDNNMVIDFKAFSGAKITASEQISCYMNDDEEEDDPKLIPISDIESMENLPDVQVNTGTSNNPARMFDPPTRSASVASTASTKLRLPPPSADMSFNNSSNAPKPKIVFGRQSIPNVAKENNFPSGTSSSGFGKKKSVFGIQSEKPADVSKHSSAPKPLPLHSNSVKDPLNTESPLVAKSITDSELVTKSNTESGLVAKPKVVTFSDEVIESSASNVHSSIDRDESFVTSPTDNKLDVSMSFPIGNAKIEQFFNKMMKNTGVNSSSSVPTSVPVVPLPIDYDEGDETDTELSLETKETTSEKSTKGVMESGEITPSEEQDSIERSVSIQEFHSPSFDEHQADIPNVSAELLPFETKDGISDLQKDDFKVFGDRSIVKSQSDEETVQKPELSDGIEKKEESVEVKQVCPIRTLKEKIEDAIKNYNYWDFHINMLTVLKNSECSKSQEESGKWKDLIQSAHQSFADSFKQA